MVLIECLSCHGVNEFDQPYEYHAGFSNVGFLYDESGLHTLVWSSFDPAYAKIVGSTHPWDLSAAQRQTLEAALLPSPDGSAWRFENPARCKQCGQAIKGSIISDIYYVKYPGSLDLDRDDRFHEVLSPAA